MLDSRPPPLGAPYGARAGALWFMMTATILLGAALALKSRALYPAYGDAGRPWGLSALQDERLGGLIVWMPDSLAGLPALFFLMRLWNAQEARAEGRRAMAFPVRQVQTPNHRVALWLALAAFLGFSITLAIGLLETRGVSLFAPSAAAPAQ